MGARARQKHGVRAAFGESTVAVGALYWPAMTGRRPVAFDDATPESDAALLAQVRAGDAEASRILVERYLGRLVKMAYRMLGDAHEAEDVAQETFIRLWRHAARWRADAPLIHWLRKVAYNQCIDRLRKRQMVDIDQVPEPVDPADDPAAAVDRREIAAAVDAAIAELPERQRAAIVFVHQEGLGNIETAALMGISVEAVESLLARGRRKLRERLVELRPEIEGEI